jgi:hypothetical protein
MTLGDWISVVIMGGTFTGGAYALGRMAWREWGLRAFVLTIMQPPAPEITSSPDPEPAAIASPPRTDAGTDGRTPPIVPELRPASLDTVRELRAHGFTRDAARALLRREGRSLGNNTWADAAPADDDEIVTPYAGRRTKASYYPENPELEYVEPRV